MMVKLVINLVLIQSISMRLKLTHEVARSRVQTVKPNRKLQLQCVENNVNMPGVMQLKTESDSTNAFNNLRWFSSFDRQFTS